MTAKCRRATVRVVRSLLLAGLLLQSAPDAGGRQFVATLLRGLEVHDARAVARLFRYPFRTTVPGVPYPVAVNSAADLLPIYDFVFNPRMRCAIERGRTVYSEGVVSLADGHLIAARTGQGFRVTTLAVLPGGRPPRRAPRALTTASRFGEMQASGRIGYDDVDTYLVRVRAGDVLTVHIDGFAGRSLLLRVRETATGETIRGAATEFARTWSARIERAGEYRVEVARNGGYCDADVIYTLSAAIR